MSTAWRRSVSRLGPPTRCRTRSSSPPPGWHTCANRTGSGPGCTPWHERVPADRAAWATQFASAQAQFVMAGAPKVHEEAERARLRGLLDDATAGLSPGEREVIELELRQGLAVAEIASVVGVSRTRPNPLASRAREHLETSLAAVVVARAGRRDCRLLSGMLAGWDGQLTVTLREQLHRHIGRCATCSTRRDLELHPGRLLGQSPGEALAAAAADSLRAAAGAPDALRAHTLALAAGQEPKRLRTGALCSVRPGYSTPWASPSGRPSRRRYRPAGTGAALPAGGERVVVAAGLVGAAFIGSVAVALIDSSGHGKQAAGHLAIPCRRPGPRPRRHSGPCRGPRLQIRRPVRPPRRRRRPPAPPRPRRRARLRGEPCDDAGRSPVRDDQPDSVQPAASTATPTVKATLEPFPSHRRAARCGTARRHHDPADRARWPGDLLEHRVRRVRHGQPSPPAERSTRARPPP